MANLERWAPMYRRRSAWEETGDMMTQLSSLYQMLLTQRQQQMQAWESKNRIELEERRLEHDISIGRQTLDLDKRRTTSVELLNTSQANLNDVLGILHMSQARVEDLKAQALLEKALFSPYTIKIEAINERAKAYEQKNKMAAGDYSSSKLALYQRYFGVIEHQTFDDGSLRMNMAALHKMKFHDSKLKDFANDLVGLGIIPNHAGLVDLGIEAWANYLRTPQGMEFEAAGGLINAGMFRQRFAEVLADDINYHPAAKGKVIRGLGVGGQQFRDDVVNAISASWFIGTDRELLRASSALSVMNEVMSHRLSDINRINNLTLGVIALADRVDLAKSKGFNLTEETLQGVLGEWLAHDMTRISAQDAMFGEAQMAAYGDEVEGRELRLPTGPEMGNFVQRLKREVEKLKPQIERLRRALPKEPVMSHEQLRKEVRAVDGLAQEVGVFTQEKAMPVIEQLMGPAWEFLKSYTEQRPRTESEATKILGLKGSSYRNIQTGQTETLLMDVKKVHGRVEFSGGSRVSLDDFLKNWVPAEESR